jgi:HAD superfamily hydrolase (TIGR01490 family)
MESADMNIALFDLDYTLISFDSDHAWGEYLGLRGKVDAADYNAKNDKFYEDYRAGKLVMADFLRFSLEPLGRLPLEESLALRRDFMRDIGLGKVLPLGRELVRLHQGRGDRTAIVTATNRFVTEPFAEAFGVDRLLATEILWKDGRPTGEPWGQPCFREGKIAHVQEWLDGFGAKLRDCCFYTDSHNDLPLLEAVGRAVAVDPDATLLAAAKRKGWPVLGLR